MVGDVQRAKSNKQWIIVFVIIILILLGVGIYSFLKISNQEAENSNTSLNSGSSNTLANQVNSNLIEDVLFETYINSDYGFSIEYPADWQYEASSTSSGSNEIFSLGLSYNKQAVGLSVMSDEMEGLLRNSISVEKESTLEINGVAATKLEGSSAKDGSLINIIIIKKENKLYSLRGIGSNFNEIVASFKLL